MKRMLATGCLLIVFGLIGPDARPGEPTSAKEALQALNDYIGGWKGNGTSEKNQTEIWKESARWSWRFKGKDAWLTLDLKDGKHFKRGEMRYLTDRGVYQLTIFDKSDKARAFEGKIKNRRLVLTRDDKDSGATQQLQMYMAGGGLRFIYEYAVKPANRTLFSKDFQVAMTREGETFGTAGKKVECIVTGGLGTSAVMYKGVTYYVCCSGCRDAFNEDPERYLMEYNARKKGK
ncbi:MAG: YHS domain-containing protein [Gemmataceae bacterium]|nr:YHS domain-containing protein [Gemmataceae bacterium]